MSHEQVLSETLKDFFLIKFHPKQRNGLIIQGKEKIANKLNFYSDLEAIHKELEKLDVSNSEVLKKKLKNSYFSSLEFRLLSN